MWKIMVADHQKSGSESKRGVPKRPFGELYVLHLQTDDFFRTKSCGKQEKLRAEVETHRNGAEPSDDLTMMCLYIAQ